MNSDEIQSLIVKLLLMILTPIATKYHIDGNLVPAIAADVASLVVLGYGIFAHWNMKKVPQNSTAVETDGVPLPVGSNLPPSAMAAKVVGALLMGFLISQHFLVTAAFAQPKLTGNPVADVQSAFGTAQTSIATFLTRLADIDGAVTLSTQIPGLQDNVGKACWSQFAPIQALIKAHPLPLTFRVASDVEAARLAALAMNQVCANPNCGQMFLDATNAAAAISGAPLPFSLTSLCAKVPVIGTTAATPAAVVTTAPSPPIVPATPSAPQ